MLRNPLLLLCLTTSLFSSILLGAISWMPESPLVELAQAAEESVPTPLFIDFVQYWSSARLLLEGSNPYDPAALFAMQKVLIPSLDGPILQWTPPTVFLLTVPFALLPFEIAQKAWVAALVATLAFSLLWLMRLTSLLSAARLTRWRILGALLLFFPLWESLRFGQISPFLLLGFTLFLVNRDSPSKSSPYSELKAGIALSLTSFKPHLLFLVYAALLVEALRMRSLRPIAGLAIGTLLLSALPMLINGAVWAQYIEAYRAWPSYFQTPTLGSWIQSVFPSVPTVRLVPSLLAAVVVGVWLWSKTTVPRYNWHFLASLTCFSLWLSPYGWSFDHVLMLPIVLLLLRASTTGFWGVLLIHVLAFPWSGKTPMENLMWYPATLGLLSVICLSRRMDRISETLTKPE